MRLERASILVCPLLLVRGAITPLPPCVICGVGGRVCMVSYRGNDYSYAGQYLLFANQQYVRTLDLIKSIITTIHNDTESDIIVLDHDLR